MAIKKRKEDHLGEGSDMRLHVRPLSEDTPSNDTKMGAELSHMGDSADVGRLLRATRLGLGQSIEDICQLLRIRKIYIEAIENSDYSVLPNGPYGLGFVKAYAEHLGLDGTEISRRFREECNAPAVRTELSFPKPVQESRVPGGAVLLIAAMLGIGVYGGWYYLSSQGKTIADLVDPLPEQLASYSDAQAVSQKPRSLENAAEAQAAEAGSEPTLTEETQTVLAAPAEGAAETPVETVSGAGDVAPEQAQEAEPATAPTDMADAAPALDVAEAPAVEATPAETTPAEQSIPVPEMAPDREATAPEVAEVAEVTEAAPAAEVGAVPEAPSVEDVGGGRVFGAVNVDSRVTISAVETSWVRIREADGNVLLTRMLSAGDIYHVPNRDGLKLEVGNAGALTYSIDGAEAQPVGDYGAVIADFSLNVDDLTAKRDETATQ